MAVLDSTSVTIDSSRMLMASGTGVRQRTLTLVLDSQGGATNYIPASALGGMTKILSSSLAQKSDDALAALTCPSYDGSKLFFYNLANATDATRDDPVDFTGTFRVTVIGL